MSDLTNAQIDAIVYVCRQTGDDSTYAIVRAALRASGVQAQPVAAGFKFPYDQTFQAIAAATKLQGDAISVSVKGFQEAFNAYAAPAPQEAPTAPTDPDKIVSRWMRMIDYAYQCRDDIRDSSGNTPRSHELRFLADEMRAAMSTKESGNV